MPKPRMRIILVNDQFLSEGMGTQRITEMGRGFEKLGHLVTYVCHMGYSTDVRKLFTSASQKKRDNPLLMRARDFTLYRYIREAGEADIMVVELPDTAMKVFAGALSSNSSFLVFDYGGIWQTMWERLNRGFTARPLSNLPLEMLEDLIVMSGSRLCDLQTAASSELCDLHYRLFRRKAELLLNPVDMSSFEELYIPNKIPERYRHRKNIAYMVKGENTLIRVMEELKNTLARYDATLLVVGESDRAKTLSVARNYSDHFCFLGHVAYQELPTVLSTCLFSLVMNPEPFESPPYSPTGISRTASSFAAGKPVIADNLSVRDYVTNGINGYMVQDFPSLRQRVEELLADEEKAVEMSRNALNFAKNNLDSITIARRIIELANHAH